jgi:hypothetical protein
MPKAGRDADHNRDSVPVPALAVKAEHRGPIHGTGRFAIKRIEGFNFESMAGCGR